MNKSKILGTALMILALASCGSVRFDINGVDHETLIVKTVEPEETGCTNDSECGQGRVCATVRGEYPGSCASTGGGALLIGAAILGAAVMAGQDGGGGGISRGAAAEPAQNGNYQGCCSYHTGVNSCGGTKIICNDGWISGCDC
jgi:hypothetical protein